jgi:hypothetical protein
MAMLARDVSERAEDRVNQQQQTGLPQKRKRTPASWATFEASPHVNTGPRQDFASDSELLEYSFAGARQSGR